jgi:hypothetical protein
MANTVILPTFANETDRLLFLSRLWGVILTPQDVLDWEAFKLTRPTTRSVPTETKSEFSERVRLWHEARVNRVSHYILAKYEGYGLGKVKAQAAAWLATRPTPNRTQARQAVLLQLQDKWQDKPAVVNAATQLLPLVTGIVW